MIDDDISQISTTLLGRILEVAMDASKKAGYIIIGNAGGAEVTERKANSRDLLTLIDPMCEKVRRVILQTNKKQKGPLSIGHFFVVVA